MVGWEGVLEGLISMEGLAPPTMHCVMTEGCVEKGDRVGGEGVSWHV